MRIQTDYLSPNQINGGDVVTFDDGSQMLTHSAPEFVRQEGTYNVLGSNAEGVTRWYSLEPDAKYNTKFYEETAFSVA